MPRPSKTDQELGMLRSFWDTIGTIEGDFGGVVSIFVNRTRRPGVCSYRMVFTPLLEDTQNPLGSGAVQIEYPNSAPQTLAGALWKGALDLHRTLSDQQITRAKIARRTS